MTKQCVWMPEEWPGEAWETSCDGLYQITTGTPEDNGMKFCPFCGGELIEKEREESNDD